ncbi:uncharacterized protein LOC133286514 [Gastrolobium bilobum]|uniref:uncharacterized protein LOC133286514 n=1 Tax=Gastrolobium bilobum TaxID=150636 RepID=UPI002AB24A30|nr:uncharacterized protein LOC133286514 [Gastrolobium bilobum]
MIENERLSFIRHNQDNLKANLYQNFIHAFKKGEDVAAKTGKCIIIPSSFIGGPRYMAESCKDAFAICRWAGYPYLFITITCNPKWPEISRLLNAKNLKPEDRPDILCRVFKFKLDQLLNDLRKEHFLGRVNAYVCTIEFQKGGLPHAHILLFLHPSDKPNSGIDIDRLISAEIPNKDTHPSLFSAVNTYMMHGPCGPDNYNSPCMKDGNCSKKFPKNFCSRTFIDDDGFPHYKRNNDGTVVNKNGVELDNRMSLHVKQLGEFLDLMFIADTPLVQRLPFHLPNQKSIVFSDSASIFDVKTRAESRRSMFESWMEANKNFLEGRDLTYAEYPTYFVYKEDTQEWHPRKKGFSIGRLLDYDNEYIDAITEASTWGSAAYLRYLFALLLFTNSMTKPENVWEKCWKFLSDDVLYMHRKSIGRQDAVLTEESIKNTTLAEIDKVLQSNGRCLSDYPSMPRINGESLLHVQNRLVLDELLYDRFSMMEEHKRLKNSMTDEQRNAYENIVSAVSADAGGLFFLYGFGGTRKTFIWNTLSAYFRSNGEIVLNVSSSGIASLLLPGGRTAHSRFRIPIHITEDSTCNITQNSPLAELLAKTKLIIWDEAPMVHRFCFEALDKTLRDILRFSDSRCVDKPFGGKVIVLGGNFRQILPVIPHGSRQQIVNATINSSHLWSHCQDNNSQIEDDEFSPEILNTFSCSGIPDHKLILKVNVPVMLLRNIDQSRGLCNGTRFLISRLGNCVVEGTVLTGSNIGETVLIPRMTMSPSSHSFPIHFQRRQFPLVVSFAMSINKSQGQSLSHVGIYLPRPVFTHGQLYVALSRVKRKQGLKILILDDNSCVTNRTFNIVYKEVFQRLM